MSEATGKLPGFPEETEGGLTAPVIYFESVATQGVGPAVGRIALEMVVLERSAAGVPTVKRKITAQLRGPLAAFADLRMALDDMERLLAPPPPDQKPN